MTEKEARQKWADAYEKARFRQDPEKYMTVSSEPVPPLCGPSDIEIDYEADLGYPGQWFDLYH
jgi:hypothetical protein